MVLEIGVFRQIAGFYLSSWTNRYSQNFFKIGCAVFEIGVDVQFNIFIDDILLLNMVKMKLI